MENILKGEKFFFVKSASVSTELLLDFFVWKLCGFRNKWSLFSSLILWMKWIYPSSLFARAVREFEIPAIYGNLSKF